MTCVAAAALMLVHASASALSLGRLNVQSALGEALRAEIDVASITPEESDTLRAALASPDAFRAAGVDFNAALTGARASLVRRGDGRSVIRIQGDRAVTEPFVDVLLDVAWSSGHLQRAYTLLIDPPRVAPSPAAPVTAPVMSAAPQPAPVEPVAPAPAPVATPAPAAKAAPAPAPARPPRPAPAPAPAPAPKAKAPAAAPAASAPTADAYRVRAGDTLSRIAGQYAGPGVSLDQMLVALYRGNPQAFVDNNMNRLKSGVVLDVGQAQAAATDLSATEARRVIQAQSADFAAYRQRLAGAAPAVRSTEPALQAKGKVEAAVQDRKAEAAPTPDKLTLSKGAVKPGAEAKVSHDTERKAADTRMAELARNVEELKRLSASAARGGTPEPAKPAPTAPTTPTPTVAVTAPVTAPVAPASVPTPQAAAPVTPASVVQVQPGTMEPAPKALAPASAPASMAAASEPEAPAVASEPAADEEGLLDNPLVTTGMVLVVALLAGWGFTRLRRRNESGETSFIESKMQPDSFFGVSGGQRVDTADGASSAASSLSYSLSQLDAIGDVDPVAEADVYLAYGRDLQAEEILKEALRSDSDRLAIRTKLLEVYAKRSDAKSFEAQAEQLHGLTQGQGEDWARAAELGRQLDPNNPLYAAPVGASAPAVDPDATVIAPAAAAPAVAPAPASAGAAEAGPMSGFELDIDLDSPSQLTGLENTRPLDAARTTTTAASLGDELSTDSADLDLAPRTVRGLLDDDGGDAAEHEALPGESAGLPDVSSITTPGALDETPARRAVDEPRDPPVSGPVDFDFGDLSLDLDVAAPAPAATAPTAEPMVAGGAMAAPAADFAAEPDLSDFELEPVAVVSDASDLDAGEGDPLDRKIELANEFRHIGDIEGARELLEEVISKADGALRARAQSLLDELRG